MEIVLYYYHGTYRLKTNVLVGMKLNCFYRIYKITVVLRQCKIEKGTFHF